MIYKNDISSIKNEIGEKIGQKIIVKGSLGRNKPFEEQAVIKETYPNIFVVKYEEHDTNVSYRYTYKRFRSFSVWWRRILSINTTITKVKDI